MIENIVRRAIGYTGNIFTEFRNEPAHWSNNKRRLHGMGPLRKRSNYKGRKNMLQSVMISALASVIEEIIPEIIEETVSSIGNVRDLR